MFRFAAHATDSFCILVAREHVSPTPADELAYSHWLHQAAIARGSAASIVGKRGARTAVESYPGQCAPRAGNVAADTTAAIRSTSP